MLKNFKYYAGLMDSDGYIGLSFNKSTNGKYSVYANAAIRLRWDSAVKCLVPLAEEFGVKLCKQEKTSPPGEPQIGITLSGTKAVQFLDQIRNHLVIKRDMAEFVASVNGKSFESEELPALRKKLKDIRASRTLSKKNYPSRQWAAGYIDGDGCFSAIYDKKYGGLAFKVIVASHKDDPQGVELMAKHYGGVIHVRKDQSLSYVLALKPDKATDKFFEGVLPHLKVKRIQADLIRSVLRKRSHLKKNGATPESNFQIHQKLKDLKKPNRPQRLNETAPEGEATV